MNKIVVFSIKNKGSLTYTGPQDSNSTLFIYQGSWHHT